MTLRAAPPAGAWTVEALAGRRVGALERLAPATVLDGLPALFGDGRLAAIPHLGLWRGPHGPFWASNLACAWLTPDEAANFRLVP
ncbi:MAG: hypothetical protein H6844_12215 [Alphaproteobacteria bacterium]|nr:hypothetical protein [Alphaproteobacteria bacterium]